MLEVLGERLGAGGGHWRRRIRRGPQAQESHKASRRAHFRCLPSVWAREVYAAFTSLPLCWCLEEPRTDGRQRGETSHTPPTESFSCRPRLGVLGCSGKRIFNSKCILEGSGSGHVKYRNKAILVAEGGGTQRILHHLRGLRSALRLYSRQKLKRAGSGRHIGCFKTPVFYLELRSSPGCEPTK